MDRVSKVSQRGVMVGLKDGELDEVREPGETAEAKVMLAWTPDGK